MFYPILQLRERAERSKKMIAEAIADETFQEQLVLNDDLIWASGVGTTGDPVDINARLDRNRIETLKLLVSCFSIFYIVNHINMYQEKIHGY